jgi:rhomboid family GlyGly-CTERM serine protease
VTNLSASLQWSDGRWIWLFGILAVGTALLGLGDSALSVLRYDRAAIGAGQWWRLVSAHAVHADAHHFALNALGLVLVWSLFATEYRAVEWTLIVCLSALAIGLGLWWFDPTLQWYVGASGVLHAVMAGGCVKRIAQRQWDRWILAVGLTLKLVIEQGWQAHGHSMRSGDLPIVIDAHLYGAVAGALIGAALCARMAIIRQNSH